MSLLPIYIYNHEVLRKKAKPVTRVTDEIVRLIMDMYETMHKAQGIGLAANQVGSLHRVIVVDLSEMEEMKDFPPLTLINPEIISSEGTWTMEEGCLSIPDVRDEVDRVAQIKMRYRDTNFQPMELEANNLLARVILHEIDHLNGVLFIDHLSRERKKLHHDKLKSMQRGEVEVPYPIVTPSKITL